MGTIAEKLAYTSSSVNDIQTAMEECGLIVGDSPLDSYANKIRSIPSLNITQSLPPPFEFIRSSASDNKVNLTWHSVDSPDFASSVLVRNTEHYPADPSDGTVIYRGPEFSFDDLDVTNGTEYYYRVFSANSNGDMQTFKPAIANSVPGPSMPAIDLVVGDRIKMGTYMGEEIIWLVVHISDDPDWGDDLFLITEKCVARYCRDTKEPNSTISTYRNEGMGKWDLCNIRQWLNSAATDSSWFVGKSTTDTAPADLITRQGGFLREWTMLEMNALVDYTYRFSVKYTDDPSGVQMDTTKMRLPSRFEFGWAFDSTYCTNAEEGFLFSYFDDFQKSKGYYSPAAAERYGISPTEQQPIMLRTSCIPYSENYPPLILRTSGSYYSGFAYLEWALRPLCNIARTQRVSTTMDTDFCYRIM